MSKATSSPLPWRCPRAGGSKLRAAGRANASWCPSWWWWWCSACPSCWALSLKGKMPVKALPALSRAFSSFALTEAAKKTSSKAWKKDLFCVVQRAQFYCNFKAFSVVFVLLMYWFLSKYWVHCARDSVFFFLSSNSKCSQHGSTSWRCFCYCRFLHHLILAFSGLIEQFTSTFISTFMAVFDFVCNSTSPKCKQFGSIPNETKYIESREILCDKLKTLF